MRLFLCEVLQNGRVDSLPKFVADSYVDHSAHASDAASLGAFLREARAERGYSYESVHRVAGDAGGLVATLSKAVHERTREEFAVFDLFRVAGGRIAEHWDSSEPIGPRSEWANGGKF